MATWSPATDSAILPGFPRVDPDLSILRLDQELTVISGLGACERMLGILLFSAQSECEIVRFPIVLRTVYVYCVN